MEKKIQEMIALGASYALNCRPCMEYHKKGVPRELQTALLCRRRPGISCRNIFPLFVLIKHNVTTYTDNSKFGIR